MRRGQEGVEGMGWLEGGVLDRFCLPGARQNGYTRKEKEKGGSRVGQGKGKCSRG